MWREDSHPTEEELLLLVDGELSTRRASRIRAHLTACWDCRARMAEIEQTITDFVRTHRQSIDPMLPPAAEARAQLRYQMAELALRPQPDSWRRFFRSDRVIRFGVYGTVAAVLTVLGGEAIYHRFTPRVPDPAIAAFAHRAIPDRNLTPGAARQVAINDICSVAHEEVVKPVSLSLRQQVFREYGIINPNPDDYEIDYLIAPRLGGLEDIQNLWPEPNASPTWNSHAKDALEERLHQLVCSGKLDVTTAQHDISINWIAAYKKYLPAEGGFPESVNSSQNRLTSLGAF
jgi:Putative zinc-finger